jgi:transcriptional regulator with XRE-family HTH domain
MSKTIYEILEDTRKNRGLSQRRAADALDTTPTTWRSWSRGQIPGWVWIVPFAEFTGQPREAIINAIAEQARASVALHNVDTRPVEWFPRPIDFQVDTATLVAAA